MLTLLVFALVTQVITGQSQCPQVAASFGYDLDLTSLYVSLDDAGANDDGSAASGGGSCKSFDVYCAFLHSSALITQS